MTVEEVLAEIRSLGPGESFSYRSLAKKHLCSRTTLTEQHQGRRTTRAGAHDQRRLLSQRNELELIQYIRSLTKKHCPPTRQMIINFATPLCQWEPSEAWVSRLIHRHNDHLLTAWTTPMESSRHKADNGERYRLYFGLLARKVAEFEVDTENTYNMDEKGFMIGVIVSLGLSLLSHYTHTYI
jgi:hypothetical protein